MATVKKYLLTTDDSQVVTNKTINAGANTVTNIDIDNLKQKTALDEDKTFLVQSDGTWALGKLSQYKRVSTFATETGNGKTLYYLDTAYDAAHPKGLYIYNTATATFVACSINGNVAFDGVTIGLNADGELHVLNGDATKGLTVAKFNTNAIATAVAATASAVDTKVPTELAVRNAVDATAKSLEFTMDASTFVLTAILKDGNGVPLSTQTVDLPLEQMVVNVSYDNVTEQFIFTLKDGSTIKVPASGILKGVVTQTATQTLTNKTIDVDNNTVSNIEVDNIKPAALRTSATGNEIRPASTATDTCLATEKAIRAAIDAAGTNHIPYNDGSASDKTFNIGWDTTGIFVLRETTP